MSAGLVSGPHPHPPRGLVPAAKEDQSSGWMRVREYAGQAAHEAQE